METEALKALTGSLQKPTVLKFDDDHQAVALPPDYTLRDLSDVLPPAAHISQSVELHTTQAFCEYVTKWDPEKLGTVFANETAAFYEAVLDYHGHNGARGDCEHIANYSCPQSEEWKRWTGSQNKCMTQIEFGRFLEENLPDISAPPAAELLEIALSMEVHKGAKFGSAIRLSDGRRQFEYVEEIKGSTKNGSMSIPETFVIALPVFIEGPKYSLQARLRYRMKDGDLTVWYELVRHLDVWRLAVQQVTASIRKGIPEHTVLVGRRA